MRAARVGARIAVRLLADSWWPLVYVILIALCVIFAPAAPLKFIYTEF